VPVGQSALQATRSGDVRSAVLHCTATAGRGACGGSDRTAPAIAVKGIRNGQTFAAKDAPRTLHGTATDPSGASVRLRLVRSVGSSCSYFDARREAFRRCGSVRAPLFSAGDRSHWSYLLPQRLPAGRYVLGVRATDKAGNADSLRLRFDVATPRAAATAAASAPRVETMVVGTAGTLLAARTVTASAASVTVGRRSCAVAAGTPLAVLLAARRAGGPGLAVVDQGACSRNPRDAYGLFVTRIGSERNRGQAGWVYKVGRRGGTAGAGDASGPFGAGPLASGSRVLWFYCRVASRCQSSLEATAPRSARPGAPVVVHVRAYDDNGRGRAVAGVAVHFGDAQVATGSDGSARFTAPQRPGRFVLSATRPGLVPAFPSEVAVR
jgi:hypothetical protein